MHIAGLGLTAVDTAANGEADVENNLEIQPPKKKRRESGMLKQVKQELAEEAAARKLAASAAEASAPELLNGDSTASVVVNGELGPQKHSKKKKKKKVPAVERPALQNGGSQTGRKIKIDGDGSSMQSSRKAIKNSARPKSAKK